MSSLSVIPSDLSKEFAVNADGTVTASQYGIARLAGVEQSSVSRLLARVKSSDALDLPQTLQAIAGQSFEANALTEIAATCILSYYAHEAGRNKTKQALAVVLTFSAKGFEQWVQNSLGWKSGQPSASHAQARLEGKEVRRTLTDAIKGYIDRHPELSNNSIKFMYANASDGIYLKTHGVRARKLVEALDCSKHDLRNNLTSSELVVLSAIEQISMRLIELNDTHPLDAIKDAVERAVANHLFEDQTQKLIKAQ